MRDTELLVPAVMASKLERAAKARLGRLARSTRSEAVARPTARVDDPCRDSTSPDCMGQLRPINRPA